MRLRKMESLRTNAPVALTSATAVSPGVATLSSRAPADAIVTRGLARSGEEGTRARRSGGNARRWAAETAREPRRRSEEVEVAEKRASM